MTNILFLADFSVIRPEPGLLIWTLLIFALFWFLLGRFAFGPIQKALKKREQDIQDSLDEAKKAREEMANLTAQNERLLVEAREERAKILREAKDAKNAIIEEAKEKAREEARRLVVNAKQEIENQRKAAVTDLKNQVGLLAVEIAEKILQQQLKNKADQQQYVNDLVKKVDLN